MKPGARLAVLALVAFAAACSSEDLGSSGERVTVCGQTTVKGVDVYHGDNGGSPIDWNKVKAAGISFAFAKATESTNFTDSAFAANWSGMKAAGLVRGAYHFFHSDVDPTQQATFFLSTVGAVEQGDLLVLDLESANGQSQATILANAETFMSAVKSQSGVLPILYVSPAFLSSFGTLGNYPLWVANYGVNCPDVPSAWKTYTFWQSTGSGSLSALSGAVDLDTFNGTLSALTTFANSTWLAAPPADAGTNDASQPPPPQDSGAKDAAAEAEPTDEAGAPPPPSDDGGTDGQTTSGCSASPARGPDGSAWLTIGALAALSGLRKLRARRVSATSRAQ